MKTQLMPQGYFDDIQREMVKRGFTLIARVAIDNTECEYHIPVTVARATSLFFHVRRKSIMVMLRFYEDDYRERGVISGRWVATLYVRFLDYGTLLEQNPHWIGQSMNGEGGTYHDMPILGSTPLRFPGFRCTGGLGLSDDGSFSQVGCRFEDQYGGGVITSFNLAHQVRVAVGQVEKYADDRPFHGISLIDFVPHYVFSGKNHSRWESEKLEELFWSKFDWSYFRHLVVRPYGYNFRRKQPTAA